MLKTKLSALHCTVTSSILYWKSYQFWTTGHSLLLNTQQDFISSQKKWQRKGSFTICPITSAIRVNKRIWLVNFYTKRNIDRLLKKNNNKVICSWKKRKYSRVHISSNNLFSKIMKKPSIVQKNMTPHMNRLLVFFDMKQFFFWKN